MKTKEILIELIENLSKYENERVNTGASLNMTDFLGFMNSHYSSKSIKTRELRGDSTDFEFKEEQGSVTDISILIALMFRYAKGYIKKALKGSPINTADEFSFLITLITYDSLSKTELIQKQVMEKTSGTEIINRLLKYGLIDQFHDETDKRSIRVKMTALGKTELMKVLPQMKMVSQIVTGNLTESEINALAYMLRKLDIYHNDIYLNKKDSDLNLLLQ